MNRLDPLGLTTTVITFTTCVRPFITQTFDDGHQQTLTGAWVCSTTTITLDFGPAIPLGPGDFGGTPDCIFNIKLNNKANLSDSQIAAIEKAIQSLFAGDNGALGVNFVSSNADYTLNIKDSANPKKDDDLGHQTSWLGFQGTPVVHPNNIRGNFSRETSQTIDNVMGEVGAHELIHRIAGTLDLPYSPSHPDDLMAAGSNPNSYNLFAKDGFQISAADLNKLLQDCLKKHPKK